ncbi:MAG: oligosaccharide flippase family protein [Candidatus Riflebacteria bacterium]|nr:oligosaccharide flippase family protein [Candidatus Riflebacteria bacterium]
MADLETRGDRLAEQGVANLAATALPLVATLLITPSLVRTLGFTAYGVYQLLLSLAAFMTLLDFNLGSATTYLVAKECGRGDRGRAGSVVRASLLAHLLLGLSAALAAGLGGDSIMRWIARGHAEAPVARWSEVAGATTLVAATFLLGGAAAVAGGVGRIAAAAAASGLAATLGIVGTWALALGGCGLDALLAWQALCALVAATALAALGLRELGGSWAGAGVADLSSLRPLFAYGAAGYLGRAAATLSTQLDRMLLAAAARVEAVTVYAVCSRLATVLTTAGSRLGFPLVPWVSAHQHDRDGGALLRQRYQESARLLGVASAFLAGLLVGLAAPLLELWMGPQFAVTGAPVLAVLGLAQLFGALTVVPSCFAMGSGRPALCGMGHMVQTITMLSMIPPLARAHGALGAALAALVCGSVFGMAFVLFVERRVVGLGGLGLAPLYVRLVTVVAAMTATAWTFEPLAPGGVAARLALEAAAAAIAGTIVAWTVGAIRFGDMEQLANEGRRFVIRFRRRRHREPR